jgi:hypothetical protein
MDSSIARFSHDLGFLSAFNGFPPEFFGFPKRFPRSRLMGKQQKAAKASRRLVTDSLWSKSYFRRRRLLARSFLASARPCADDPLVDLDLIDVLGLVVRHLVCR